MLALKTVLAAATLFVGALGQASVAFMSVPPVAVAGSTYNITWGGGDGTAVTLTLKNGSLSDLNTVSTITDSAKGYSYSWTVDTSLATASNYLLQITQGVNEINFSGFFSIVGGTGTSSISYSGLTTQTSSTGNGTTITTAASLTGTAASMGTGTNLPRNTTFSSASLTGKTTTTAASTIARVTSSASSTSSSAAPTSNVGASSMGSSAAMVMGLFGAIMFLQ